MITREKRKKVLEKKKEKEKYNLKYLNMIYKKVRKGKKKSTKPSVWIHTEVLSGVTKTVAPPFFKIKEKECFKNEFFILESK